MRKLNLNTVSYLKWRQSLERRRSEIDWVFSLLFLAFEQIGQLLERRVETVGAGRLFALRDVALFRLRQRGGGLRLIVLGDRFRRRARTDRAAAVDRTLEHGRNTRPGAFDLRLGDQPQHRLDLRVEVVQVGQHQGLGRRGNFGEPYSSLP